MTTARRRCLGATTGWALALGLSLVAGAQVPMREESHHHFVFENDTLRILEPRIDPDDTTLDHIHSHDSAIVCITGSTLRTRVLGAEWGDAGLPCRSGQASVTKYVEHHLTHRAQNVGSSSYRVVLVENLHDSGWSNDEPLSAAFTTTLQDTRAFLIYQVHLRFGSEATTHVHRRSTVAVLVSGELLLERRTTKEVVRLDQPGRWVLIAAGESYRLTAGPVGEALADEVEIR
jgi:mannose-6-phosphate isomerase-like protein (cupin superfamily)